MWGAIATNVVLLYSTHNTRKLTALASDVPAPWYQRPCERARVRRYVVGYLYAHVYLKAHVFVCVCAFLFLGSRSLAAVY